MISRELKAASTKPLILTILARKESYGYEILQDISSLSGGKWEWSEAMLYPVLKRLQSEGLINSKWVQLENGRKRKYYALTILGKESLATERANWLNVNEVLATLWNQLDPSIIKK